MHGAEKIIDPSLHHMNLRHRPSMDMDMCRLRHQMTDLDALYPWMVNDVLDFTSLLRVWLQHLPYQRPTCPRRQVVDGRWT
jgi:hypothetical protein